MIVIHTILPTHQYTKTKVVTKCNGYNALVIKMMIKILILIIIIYKTNILIKKIIF